MKRILKLKRIWILLLLPISLLSLFIASKSPEAAEHFFAGGIYLVISGIMSRITGLLPFSLMEFGIVFGPVLILVLLVIFVVRMIKNKDDRKFRAAKAGINIACVASLAVFLLIFGCTINYYRYTLAKHLDLPVRPATGEELYLLVEELAIETSEVRSHLMEYEDADGIFHLPMTMGELGKEAVQAFHRLGEENSLFSGYYPKPKHIFFSEVMSKMNFTGMYCPFTMEANVNIDVPHYSIASTMCHELAHLKGFIREDEANYISFLACRASESELLHYSGLMEALILSGNALYRKNPDLYNKVHEYYSDAVVRDLVANSVYWKQYKNTVISNTAEKINDSYLKANNQTDGTQSYGRMVDLLLAEYRKRHAVE